MNFSVARKLVYLPHIQRRSDFIRKWIMKNWSRFMHRFMGLIVVIILVAGMHSAAALSPEVHIEVSNDGNMTALMVKDIYTGNLSAFGFYDDMTALDDILFFTANDGAGGVE